MNLGLRPGGGRVCSARRGWGGPWAVIGWLPLALLLSSCSGTPWGERLSESFPPPEEPVPAPPRPVSESPKKASPDPSPPVRETQAPGLKPSGVAPPSPVAASGASALRGVPSPPPPAPTPPLSPSPSLPFPYRVTLRLPRADPSAPAEAVTRALRAAGIPFEVETIERVQGGATASPAAEGRDGSTLAPSVRPAPPPR
ncbi:MAG: hypothetical protein ACK6BC_09700 [Cyanobacteriota bacterium]